ncbi:MAG: coatomer subunit gamma [Amphiamblys sp. WSBS2006]|nr:MAG: coatomer subunit gamma [Amphiamblys sp. WSBS2006]
MKQHGEVTKMEYYQRVYLLGHQDTDEKKRKAFLRDILVFLHSGETLTGKEYTELFFGTLKQFQTRDTKTLRTVFLIIKAIADKASDVMMATSSLAGVVGGSEDQHCRGAAIRTLCSVSTGDMVGDYVRVLEKSLLERRAEIVEAVLGSFLQLTVCEREAASKLCVDVQKAFSPEQRGHHLGFWGLYLQKHSEPVFVSRLLQRAERCSNIPPLMACALIRVFVQMFTENPHRGSAIEFQKFLKARKGGEMVAIEAARAILAVYHTMRVDLGPVKSFLRVLLESSEPASVFAGLRTVEMIAKCDPSEVAPMNGKLVALLSSPHSAISSVAFSVLLQTADEDTVDGLFARISGTMEGFSEEIRMEVLSFLDTLVSQYPRKLDTVFSFFSVLLTSSETQALQSKAVDSIVLIVRRHPSKAREGVEYLCRFIEDCDNTMATVQVLTLLGEYGLDAGCSDSIVRAAYNRMALEGEAVREAAAATLFRIATQTPSLAEDIFSFLRKFEDDDDEAGDCVRVCFSVLAVPAVSPVLSVDSVPSLEELEETLGRYIEGETHSAPVDLSAIEAVSTHTEHFPRAPPPSAVEERRALPFGLGEPFKETRPERISEDTDDVSVSCSKHVFPDAVLFEFVCENVVSGQVVKNVSIDLGPAQTEQRGIDALPSTGPAMSCYVLVPATPSAEAAMCFSPRMTFALFESEDGVVPVEDDPGTEERHSLKEVAVSVADFVSGSGQRRDVSSVWESFEGRPESSECLVLGGVSDIREATEQLLLLLDGDVATDLGQGGVSTVAVHGRSIWAEDYAVLFSLEKKRGAVYLEVTARTSSREFSDALVGLL